VAAPCAGPAGCINHGFRSICDVSGNKEGDPCGTSRDSTLLGNKACTLDHRAFLICRDGSYVRIPCRGSDGCKPSPNAPEARYLDRCDESVAEDGDSCDRDDSHMRLVCSVDGSAVLSCERGSWKVTEACGGPGSCGSRVEYHPGRMEVLYSCRRGY